MHRSSFKNQFLLILLTLVYLSFFGPATISAQFITNKGSVSAPTGSSGSGTSSGTLTAEDIYQIIRDGDIGDIFDQIGQSYFDQILISKRVQIGDVIADVDYHPASNTGQIAFVPGGRIEGVIQYDDGDASGHVCVRSNYGEIRCYAPEGSDPVIITSIPGVGIDVGYSSGTWIGSCSGHHGTLSGTYSPENGWNFDGQISTPKCWLIIRGGSLPGGGWEVGLQGGARW